MKNNQTPNNISRYAPSRTNQTVLKRSCRRPPSQLSVRPRRPFHLYESRAGRSAAGRPPMQWSEKISTTFITHLSWQRVFRTRLNRFSSVASRSSMRRRSPIPSEKSVITNMCLRRCSATTATSRWSQDQRATSRTEKAARNWRWPAPTKSWKRSRMFPRTTSKNRCEKFPTARICS